jgi:hypothetical protein
LRRSRQRGKQDQDNGNDPGAATWYGGEEQDGSIVLDGMNPIKVGKTQRSQMVFLVEVLVRVVECNGFKKWMFVLP